MESEKRIVLRNYLKARCGGALVLLQNHARKEVCVIKKNGSAIVNQFMEAVKQASNGDIRLDESAFSLRLEADDIEHFNFLLKC